MNYRPDKYGKELSILGFGCMRFPKKNGKIDIEATERQIMLAYKSGVNYFDTAYAYRGSEAVLGEILEKNGIRDQVNIATKLPHYMIKSREGIDKLFGEELERLRTDHVEYYLMHMLNDIAVWERLCALGIKEWIAQKKASGQIGQIGFSYHGNSDMFCRLVDAYDWDFCMIQYNYMDENSQAGKRGLHYAKSKGLAVMIMEPLRGGKLVNHLPKEAKRIFEEYHVQHTPAEWAFRWLWNQPEVNVVLSGMNSESMVQNNVETASSVQVGELGESEHQMLARVLGVINAGMKVGCTGCGYCMPCPRGVDIPGTFSAYNRLYSEGKFQAVYEYAMCTAMRKNSAAASMCIGCGKCEQHCPQSIAIREQLKLAQKELEGPLYKAGRAMVSIFFKM